MSILKLAMAAPELCGAKNAARFGKIAEMVYHAEMADKNSVFARNAEDKENPRNRIDFVFAWTAKKEHEGKKQYIMDLIEYAKALHYRDEHGEDFGGFDIIKTDLEVREQQYPDVMEIQPVAEVRGTWV